MCKMCDGQTFEEALADMAAVVERRGWTLQGVERSPGSPPWVYTVGLLERFGHPELIMIGLDDPFGSEVMAHMATIVERGERLLPKENCCLQVIHTRIGRVHPAHIRSHLFNWWFNYYDSRPFEPPDLRAVQVLWCDMDGHFPTIEHRWREQPLLALPPTGHVRGRRRTTREDRRRPPGGPRGTPRR